MNNNNKKQDTYSKQSMVNTRMLFFFFFCMSFVVAGSDMYSCIILAYLFTYVLCVCLLTHLWRRSQGGCAIQVSSGRCIDGPVQMDGSHHSMKILLLLQDEFKCLCTFYNINNTLQQQSVSIVIPKVGWILYNRKGRMNSLITHFKQSSFLFLEGSNSFMNSSVPLSSGRLQ